MKQNKILFALGHPAHFHLFKNTIHYLQTLEFSVTIVISNKDILKSLLDNSGIKYLILSDNNRKKGLFNNLLKLLTSTKKLYKIVNKIQPALLIGCLHQIGYVSVLKNIPSIFVAEDDINYTRLQALITYPFVNFILSPDPVNVGLFKYKKIDYKGFQKLTYLHPSVFKPERAKVKLPVNEKYFILRLSNLSAYHDKNADGINDWTANKIINKLLVHGRVIISSERRLPEDLNKYLFSGNILDFHHYLYYANLFIGDSQSMAVESALLGTPNIRYNNFVGKISVLNVLEEKYNLTLGIKPPDDKILLTKIEEFISTIDLLETWKLRQKVMLNDMIDVNKFFIWLFSNYPNSVE